MRNDEVMHFLLHSYSFHFKQWSATYHKRYTARVWFSCHLQQVSHQGKFPPFRRFLTSLCYCYSSVLLVLLNTSMFTQNIFSQISSGLPSWDTYSRAKILCWISLWESNNILFLFLFFFNIKYVYGSMIRSWKCAVYLIITHKFCFSCRHF